MTEQKQPMMGHLIELRKRLMWAFIAMGVGTVISFFFVEEIYSFLVQPLANVMGEESTNRMIYTALPEGFLTYFKISFFTGVFLSFPILLLQIWLFIAPALYKNEKLTFLPFLIATPFLFFAGAALLYYGVLPAAWNFFLKFQSTGAETALPVQLEARMSEYLSLIMTLVFAFGLSFQLPVLLSLMGKSGMITSGFLVAKRKYALIMIFIASAFLTPADVVSLFGLAIPLYGLYEISILLVKMFERKRNAESSDQI